MIKESYHIISYHIMIKESYHIISYIMIKESYLLSN